MADLPQSLLFLGIVPALILMFISLKGYDEVYKQKNMFLSFAAGLFAGAISVIIETASIGVGLVTLIILFPVLEQLFKTIFLNIGRLQKKRETTIYGLSLGLGFGSIFTPFVIIRFSEQASLDNLSFVLLIIGSIAIILLHGATGVLIGFGVYMGELTKYLFYAIILYIPSYVFAIRFVPDISINNIIQLGLLPYSIVVYWYATTKVMPKILTKRRRTKKKSKTKEQ
jgi:hypothetical protein